MKSRRGDEATSRNDFSGDAETVVQVSDLHGDINLRSGRALPAPNQLPIAPSNFVNRKEGLQIVTRFIAGDSGSSLPVPDRSKIVAINGQPGVGKTALALRWAHQYQPEFPDGTLYIDLHAYSPELAVSTESALETFIRAFDILPESIPEEPDRRGALFRSLVSHKRMLIIIDNAANSAQVRALLPASPECPVLITSRTSLSGLATREGAMRVKLDVLSPDESVELLLLLARDGRVETEDAAVRRVAELCGYLPLALRLVGERAASRPGLSFADLADEIVSEQHRLDELAEAEDELSDTRAVFSWSYRALPSDLKEAFRVIGLHAGPDFGPGPVAALLGTNGRTAGRRLRALADANLVREAAPGSFRLHDLLRIYARELVMAQESQERRTHAVRRELSWYLLTTDVGRKALLPYSTSVDLVPAMSLEITNRFETGADAMDWFLSERRNILAAMRQCMEMGQYDIAWKLAVISSGFLELSSYWSDWKSSQELGLEAAKLLGDRLGEALNTQILGDVAWRSGDLDIARNYYEKSLVISRDLDIAWVEAFALRGIGLTYQEQDHPNSAIPLFDASLHLFREAGFRRGEGMALASIGKCALAVGDASRAISASQNAIIVLEEIDDIWTVAWSRLDLAASLERAGREAEAINTLRLAIDVFARFRDRRCEANGLVALGRLCRSIGNRSGARDAWQKALNLYKEIDRSRADEIRSFLADLPDDSSAQQ